MLRTGGPIVDRVRQMMVESSKRALLEGLTDGVCVVEVAPRLREEKDGVVGPGRPIPYRLWHWIRLRPDAIGPEPPPSSLEFESDPPRDSREVLGLQISISRAAPPLPASTASLGRVPTIRECLGG